MQQRTTALIRRYDTIRRNDGRIRSGRAPVIDADIDLSLQEAQRHACRCLPSTSQGSTPSTRISGALPEYTERPAKIDRSLHQKCTPLFRPPDIVCRRTYILPRFFFFLLSFFFRQLISELAERK